MANSCSKLHFGKDPFTPAIRTPGPLGHNDAASPDAPFRPVGDTPGPLGINDHADPAVVAAEMQKKNQAATTPATELIALQQAQEMSLRITTHFEGSKAMNYQALADDSDGQGTSFGLIQWNFGQNTLGPILKKMLNSDEKAFAACFAADADYATLRSAIMSGDMGGQLKWARGLLKTSRSAWELTFKNIGANEIFNKIQLSEAVANYHPSAVAVVNDLRTLCAGLLTRIEFRSYAAIFDLCVQQHSITKALGAIKARVKTEKPRSQLALMKIAVTERGRTANAKYVDDCISRRMGILTGSPFKSGSSKRDNPQLALIQQFGGNCVSGL